MSFDNKDVIEQITGNKKSTIKTIKEDFIKKRFMITQLMLNIVINIMLYCNEKHDKKMNKVTNIMSKLIANQYQPIIKKKTLYEV